MDGIKAEDMEGLLTEVGASMSLNTDAESQAYNNGLAKAIRFIKAYSEGRGLFQITAAMEKKKSKPA